MIVWGALGLVILAVSSFLTWASFAELEIVARGAGKVVPAGENQVIENLEGGIVRFC